MHSLLSTLAGHSLLCDHTCSVHAVQSNYRYWPALGSSLQRKDQWDEKSEAARQMSEKITEMTVLCNLPLSFVDNVGFRLFMAYAVPKYKVPSRKYIRDGCPCNQKEGDGACFKEARKGAGHKLYY